MGKSGNLGNGLWIRGLRRVRNGKFAANDAEFWKIDSTAAKELEVSEFVESGVVGLFLGDGSEGEVPRFASGRMSRYAFIASAGMALSHSYVSSFQAAYRRIEYTGGKVKDFLIRKPNPRGIGLLSVYFSKQRHSCYGR